MSSIRIAITEAVLSWGHSSFSTRATMSLLVAIRDQLTFSTPGLVFDFAFRSATDDRRTVLPVEPAGNGILIDQHRFTTGILRKDLSSTVSRREPGDNNAIYPALWTCEQKANMRQYKDLPVIGAPLPP